MNLIHAKTDLEAAEVDSRGDDEADDVGRRIVGPQQSGQDKISAVGAQNHVPVEVDGLGIFLGDLFRASGQLFAFLLCEFLHYEV